MKCVEKTKLGCVNEHWKVSDVVGSPELANEIQVMTSPDAPKKRV